MEIIKSSITISSTLKNSRRKNTIAKPKRKFPSCSHMRIWGIRYVAKLKCVELLAARRHTHTHTIQTMQFNFQVSTTPWLLWDRKHGEGVPGHLESVTGGTDSSGLNVKL